MPLGQECDAWTCATYPQYDRFVAALQAGGFDEGTELPYHQPNCYGCGPDNEEGLRLHAVAGAPGAVTATYRFGPRHEGGPGVVHGGAIAAVIDDLLGRVLVRDLVVAVTAELSPFHRAVHLDDPCELSAELVEHAGRDLHIRAVLEQHGVDKVTAEARFREIDLDRAGNRCEPIDRHSPS